MLGSGETLAQPDTWFFTALLHGEPTPFRLSRERFQTKRRLNQRLALAPTAWIRDQGGFESVSLEIPPPGKVSPKVEGQIICLKACRNQTESEAAKSASLREFKTHDSWLPLHIHSTGHQQKESEAVNCRDRNRCAICMPLEVQHGVVSKGFVCGEVLRRSNNLQMRHPKKRKTFWRDNDK